MTLVDEPRPRAMRLERVETGVRRLAGAEEAPVILLSDLAQDVAEAVAPLLARRRAVFAAAGDVGDLGLPEELGRVVVVGGPAGVAALAATAAGRVVATVMVRAESVEADGVVALWGHSVEAAHLVESFLRLERRHPAGTRVERARP